MDGLADPAKRQPPDLIATCAFQTDRFETMSVLTLSWLNRKLFQMHFGHAREKVEDRNRFVGRGRTERAEGSNLIRR